MNFRGLGVRKSFWHPHSIFASQALSLFNYVGVSLSTCCDVNKRKTCWERSRQNQRRMAPIDELGPKVISIFPNEYG
jgi:hypothetical protein